MMFNFNGLGADLVTRAAVKQLGDGASIINIGSGVSNSELEQELMVQAPLVRTGGDGDIAPIALFLAADDSGLLTGESLLATGETR